MFTVNYFVQLYLDPRSLSATKLESWNKTSVAEPEPEPPFLAGAGAETNTLFRLRLRKVSYKSIFINSFFGK